MGNQQVMCQEYSISSKSGINNIIRVFEDRCEVLVYKNHNYLGTVLIDPENISDVTPMRLTTNNYACVCGGEAKAVAHVVMQHRSNMTTVIDHINGDTLDNRRVNLRVTTPAANAGNRNTTPLNNTGVVGISRRKHPKYNYEYYRATVSDRVTPMIGAKSKTKQISKQFNINKLGDEVAFVMAKNWLTSMKIKFGYLLSDTNLND